MNIIINDELVSVKKLKERTHWFFGKQWLMGYNTNDYSETGVSYETTRVIWVSPKDVIYLEKDY